MLSNRRGGRCRIRALRDGPSGALLEGFAHKLCDLRYSARTRRRHLRSAEHFIDWTNRHGLSVSDVNAQVLERFGHHLGRCRCRYAHANQIHVLNGARMLATYLRDAHVIAASALDQEVSADPVLLSDFRAWMHRQRGTCAATLSNYARPIRELLDRAGQAPSQWDVHQLRAFVLERSRSTGGKAVKLCTTALRMFLRFLIASGQCTVGLDAAIPTIAQWRLASLPRYLPPDDVERVIAACDRTSSVGRRDRGILLLLARLGLRAGDIAHLRLRDIDWREAWVRVSGKSRRPTQLPLTQEVGQALVAYLQDGPPQTETDRVFVSCRAPFRPLTQCAVSLIVDRALRRASVARPSRGAAHSLATSMLAEGASLYDIATVLRHRSIKTTQIYAKVDVTALQAIAQPWPEVQPC